MKLAIAQDEVSSLGCFLGPVITDNDETLGTAIFWPEKGLELCFDVWPHHDEIVSIKAERDFFGFGKGPVYATKSDLNVSQCVQIGSLRQDGDFCRVTLKRVPNIPDCRVLAPIP